MSRKPKVNSRPRINKPVASSAAALRRMQSAKPRDTAPEIAIRSALHRLGLRYSVDAKPIEQLNRRADILFRSLKIAVFVDGCFWHGCPIHGTQAKANAEFWAAKINRNRERDAQTTDYLEQADWEVIRIWEHEDPILASQRILAAVDIRRKQGYNK